MSSRNVYLNKQERQGATILFKALNLAEGLSKKGQNNAETIRNKMAELIKSEPLASVEYISIADTQTLQELDQIKGPALVSLAVRFGKTRLIDNFMI